MKNFIFIAMAGFALSACNQAEIDKANQKNDSLVSVIHQRDSFLDARDSSLNEALSAFNEVERNLDSVAIKQNVIYMNVGKNGELKSGTKERINAQIEGINNLMNENRTRIAELTRKLKNSGRKNAQLTKTIETLTAQLAQKDQELTSLNERLNSLNGQVAQLQTSLDTLRSEHNAQTATLAEKTTALHTAYYIVGRSKDLEKAKLIDRKGGLLGIGKTSKLSSNFDNSKFTRIDYTQTGTIPVNSEKVKIITTHPTDSYTLETDSKDKGKVNNIVITDPEKFWSASKYLVIVKG
jgi:predicted RNase H-like nuclease (RuvC/YqgF family)